MLTTTLTTALTSAADPVTDADQAASRPSRLPRRQRAHLVVGVADGASAVVNGDGALEPAGRTGGGASAVPAGRDRYIDTLRVLALGRVIAYHVTGWVLLPILFPSMGIMFALAGSLMAASLDRSPHNPWTVLRKRLRRMLPPLWALGAVLVTIMLVIGWTATEEHGSEFSWTTILFWLVPVVDPPSSLQGADWVIPLWYIRAYLWFVLTSPILLWCFRRWKWRTFVAPLVVLLGYGAGVVTLNGAEGDVVLDWAVFGACWVLGFAHHDGLIRTIPMVKVLPAAVALIAAGLAWTYRFPDPVLGYSISDIPVADGLYCLGFVIILLRIYPDFGWITRIRWLDLLVSAMNKRAMTIYLWGNASIAAALTVLGNIPSLDDVLLDGDFRGEALTLTLTWAFIALAVLAVGWVEDVAAKRPMQLLPVPRRSGRYARPWSTKARAARARLARGFPRRGGRGHAPVPATVQATAPATVEASDRPLTGAAQAHGGSQSGVAAYPGQGTPARHGIPPGELVPQAATS